MSHDAAADGQAPALAAGRPPLPCGDPEPVRCTKAGAVLVLGAVALVTGPLLGGLVPATLALVLARQARADLVLGQGYLTGAWRLRLGEQLAWAAIALAFTAAVAMAVVWVLGLAQGGHDFPPTIN